MRRNLTLFVALSVLTLAGSARAWEVKLELEEVWKRSGRRYVSTGVPLLPGQAKETSELRLAVRGANGKLTAVPAQFRVLARWWRPIIGTGKAGDNSIRWVLVDLATDVEAGARKTYFLTNEKLEIPGGGPKLAVEETDAQIAVTTGPARFVIDRKKFSFLSAAFVDGNGDGKFAPEENLLESSPDLGTVVEDTFGEKYYSSESVRSVQVIEKGPMRVRVRARGLHRARGGKGYSRGMYAYDVFIDFFRGSTDVIADVILANNPPKSVGAPTFEDASLFLKLAGGGVSCSILAAGDSKFEGSPAADGSVCLYQDSNGAETWESCQGFDGNDQDDGWNYRKGGLASFRGYRFYKRAGGNQEEAGSGDHARGLVRLATKRGGMIAATRHFWQQFPKAVEVFGDGRFRLGLFPREYRVPHFIEDTSAKGHEIILHFYAGEKAPDAPTIAHRLEHRVYLRPEIAHQAACGALADLGPFVVPNAGLDKRPDTRNRLEDRRMLTLDTLYGNSYGWQVFGERWRSQGGSGRQGARQPMNEDDYLRRWYWTGVRDWLEVGEVRGRHFRDLRCYRIEDLDPFTYKTWLEFRANNMSEFRGDRPQPEDEEYKKYCAGKYPRCAFWLPNPEHMVLDLNYDRYLLFGDQRAFENLRLIAAHGAYFAWDHKPVVTRAQGWGWRSLFRYWELTGDETARENIGKVLDTYSALIDKPPLVSGSAEKPNWWFTTIFSRTVAMTALHTRDPRAIGLARTLAIGKEKKARTLSSLHAVLYHLTGDEKYRKLVVAEDGSPKRSLSAGGYLYVCDHWLLKQKPNPVKTDN
ncbi:MAG: hypothetical protein ACYTGB_15865 [Planctomycetota bacterium]|jgi:hypothetical protein